MNKSITITLMLLVLAFLLISPALAQEGPDEYEPNDESDLADLITAMAFSGIVGGKGDSSDWFKLDGQEGYNPGFTLYYNDAVCDIDMEIWSDEDLVGTLSATHSPDYGEFYIPGTCWIRVYAHSGQGEYTVEIQTDKNYNGDGGYSPDLCAGRDEIEPNDERDLADTISGYEFEGYACLGESDWFVLNGQEGVNPTFTLSYDEDQVDVDMEIWSNDNLVGELTSSGGYDWDSFDVPGTCYLRVYSYDGEGWYTVEINDNSGHYNPPPGKTSDCEGADEVESNDTMDLADGISANSIDGYACYDDVDWFRLDGQEGTRPTFVLNYDSSDVDVDMEIYSNDDLVGSLTSSDDPDQGTFDVPGTCYLKVYSYDGDGYYSIDILPNGGGGGHRSDCEGDSEAESNDSRSLADPINYYSIDGYACEGDEDWFELNGQEGAWPTFTIYYDDEWCDIDMEVYSGSDYVGSLTSASSPESDVFNVPGTCYIRVWAYSGEGAYTIEIEP